MSREGWRNREAIERFVKEAGRFPYRQPPDEEAVKAAGELLHYLIKDMIRGDDPKVRLGTLGYRKQRKVIYRPETEPVGTPEFEVVRRHENGEISYPEAVEAFRELIPASDRQIEDWIARLRPHVKQDNAFREWARSLNNSSSEEDP